jgi:hypothetical protein
MISIPESMDLNKILMMVIVMLSGCLWFFIRTWMKDTRAQAELISLNISRQIDEIKTAIKDMIEKSDQKINKMNECLISIKLEQKDKVDWGTFRDEQLKAKDSFSSLKEDLAKKMSTEDHDKACSLSWDTFHHHSHEKDTGRIISTL